MKNFKLLFLLCILCNCLKAQTNQGPPILLKNVNIIDGKGNPGKPKQQLLIVGQKIKKIGRRVRAPKDAQIIDCQGKTLLPGLIDMHAHMYGNVGGRIKTMFDAYPPLYLAGGVTTAFSPGEFDPTGSLVLREKIKNGEIQGPDYLTAGPYFESDSASIKWMNGDAGIAATMSKFKQWKNKIDGVKVYTNITEQQFKLVLQEAKKEDLIVTGHLSSITASNAVNEGINGLEHGIFGMSEFWDRNDEFDDANCKLAQLDLEASVAKNLITAIVQNGVYIDPTIVIFEAVSSDFEPLGKNWTDFINEQALPRYNSWVSRRNNDLDKGCLAGAIKKQKAFIKKLHESGGIIVTGTDPVAITVTPGYGLHREIELLVEAGLSNLAALKAATYNGAVALRREKSIGSIEVGKQADLVLVDGDPSVNIKDIGNTELIFKAGKIYQPDLLRQSAKGLIGKPE